jgi:predicted acyltransferase
MSIVPMSSASAPESAPLITPTASRAARLASLDVFRGLTMIGMLLVNNPGDAAAAYPQLRHSVWDGCTLADLVFPFFLFVVGTTTHLSLRSRLDRGENDAAIRRQIFRRAALLFAIGLLLNWFPFYQYGTIEGHPRASAVDHLVARLLGLRILGVLQRIAIAYVAAALLSWRASTRRVIALTAALLIGYWLALTVMPVPGEGTIGLSVLDQAGRSLSAWFDRLTLDWSRWGLGNHIWESTRVYDPEGLFSTIPAIATTMIGVVVGRWLAGPRSLGERLTGLFAAGALLTLAGLAWGAAFPINKNLWTSSYVLFTAGVGCATLATITWIIDARHATHWTTPFVVFGVNPILAYVGAELTAVLFDSTIKLRVGGRLQSMHQLVDERFLAWLPPNAASLAYSVAFVGLWYLVLLVLYRREIVFKI